MNQLTNQELFNKLREIINKNTLEIKTEIKSINEIFNEKLNNLEAKYQKIEEKINLIERANRKNNIVIFGILPKKEDLLKTTLAQLNKLFDSNLGDKDINNIYSIGKKNTIIVEFTSYLQKKKIFQKLHRLKGTGISITNDLRPEDQKINKILVKHLKEARAKNQQAQIKNFKLLVNGIPYSAQELENPTGLDSEVEFDHTPFPKNNSAPATPTIRPSYLDQSGEVFTELEEHSKADRESETNKPSRIEVRTDTQHNDFIPTTKTKNTPTSSKSTNSSYTNRPANTVKNKEVMENRALRSRKPTS